MTAHRQPQSTPAEIEEQLELQAGLSLVVEQNGHRLIVSGRVDTPGEHDAALDIVAALADGRTVDDNIELDENLPDYVGETAALPIVDISDYMPMTESTVGEIDPDFTDQQLLSDPVTTPGDTATDDPLAEELVGEGESTYVPPTDPVMGLNEQGDLEVIGGFSLSSTDSIEVEPSALDGQPGDEALADAIRRELREDASTTDLHLDVVVRNRVAHLRGVVAGIEDAENAEAVAGQVPGIVDVIDETVVAGL